MSRKSISAIYCDDIRAEVGGKQSYMGVYGAELFLPVFPFSLPKFCVLTNLMVPFDAPPKAVHIRLLNGDELLAEAKLDEDTLPIPPLPPADLESDPIDRELVLHLMFSFAPLQIQAPTRLRLRATVDGEEIKGNALKIRLPTDEERKSMGW
jgi:hypothetical protein